MGVRIGPRLVVGAYCHLGVVLVVAHSSTLVGMSQIMQQFCATRRRLSGAHGEGDSTVRDVQHVPELVGIQEVESLAADGNGLLDVLGGVPVYPVEPDLGQFREWPLRYLRMRATPWPNSISIR